MNLITAATEALLQKTKKERIFQRNGEIPLISKSNLNQNKYYNDVNCGWYDISANRCFFHFNDGWN